MVEEYKTTTSTTAAEEGLASSASEAGRAAPQNLVAIDWSMFKKELELGEGTFGTVYKVKCLKSTVVSGADGQRVIIEHKSAGQARRMLNMP